MIHEGTSDSIIGLWRFADDGWNSSVFFNQRNTIVEVVLFDAIDSVPNSVSEVG
jgi:hypothetical protein